MSVCSIPFLPFEPLTSPFALRKHLTTLGRAEEVGYERQRSRHVTRRIAREREGNARDWIPFLRSGHHSILGNPSSSGEQATRPPRRRARAGVNQAHGRAPISMPHARSNARPHPRHKAFLFLPRFPRGPDCCCNSELRQLLLRISLPRSNHRQCIPVKPSQRFPSNHRHRIPVKPSQRLVGRSIHSLTQFVRRQRGPGRDRSQPSRSAGRHGARRARHAPPCRQDRAVHAALRGRLRQLVACVFKDDHRPGAPRLHELPGAHRHQLRAVQARLGDHRDQKSRRPDCCLYVERRDLQTATCSWARVLKALAILPATLRSLHKPHGSDSIQVPHAGIPSVSLGRR
jgi:hypothetical protein